MTTLEMMTIDDFPQEVVGWVSRIDQCVPDLMEVYGPEFDRSAFAVIPGRWDVERVMQLYEQAPLDFLGRRDMHYGLEAWMMAVEGIDPPLDE